MPQGSFVNIGALQPSRLKSAPKRFCCRPTPYSLKDNSVMKSLLKLREELEREFSSSLTSCKGEARQVFSSLVNRPPVVHKSELTTLASLLTGYSKNDPLNPEDLKSSLSSCRRCQSIKIYSILFGHEQQENWDIEKFTPTALHVACLLPRPAPLVRRLVTEGAAINHANHLGQTPLHALILGFCLPVLPQEASISSSGSSSDDAVLEALHSLLLKGASVSSVDSVGETPLLYVRNLLKEGLFHRANRTAGILLQAGANIHHHNLEGRTLLSYSIQYLDDSYCLTTTLLNHGASLWGQDVLGDSSAFKWLLKAIMLQREDAMWQRTLSLLSQLMCSQPRRMKTLVARIMSRHAKCYKIFGPIFADIVSKMENYWKSPHSLTSLCRISARDSFTTPSYYVAVSKLELPPQIQRFLLLDDEEMLP